MAKNIQEKVEQIRQAVYGREVRESIASSIEAMNEQCEESAAGYQKAIADAESAVAAANSAATQADTAAGTANAAADRANKAAEAIEGTDVGDMAVQVDALEGEMDTVNSKIDGLNVPQMQQSITQLQTGKVDKEDSKGLSSNDYTAADKAKVEAIPTYAEFQLTLASGLTGELRGYRIGNLCRIIGSVQGLKTAAQIICDLPDDLNMMSDTAPTLLNPYCRLISNLGQTLIAYKSSSGDQLSGYIDKGLSSITPVNLPYSIDISYFCPQK